MRYIIIFCLIIKALISFSQEEFIGINSGVLIHSSFSYAADEWNQLHRAQPHFGMGISIVTKPKIIVGAALVTSENETGAGGFVGYQGIIKEKYVTIYPQIGFEMNTSGKVYSYGLLGGASFVFFEEASFPFSLSGGLSFLEVVSKRWSDNSESLITRHVSYSQAIMAKNMIYPVIGLSLSATDHQVYAFSIVVSLNYRLNYVKRVYKPTYDEDYSS